MQKTYRLFISHAWRHHDDYDRLINLLKNSPYFMWQNYSRPKDRPLVNPNHPSSHAYLSAKLADQIRPVHCVVVLAGIYATYSEWIQEEIDIARRMGKPIIGVRPWGSMHISNPVRDAAAEVVGWQTGSIIEAIRRNSL
ncbi:MAG: TIR domain-containing protein [Atopobiaceae bacterium]|nr:TIR domain-containing protein [Atopobiaceae bacterium]